MAGFQGFGFLYVSAGSSELGCWVYFQGNCFFSLLAKTLGKSGHSKEYSFFFFRWFQCDSSWSLGAYAIYQKGFISHWQLSISKCN